MMWGIRAGQLYTFTHENENGDYILIPAQGCRTYCLAIVISAYCFDKNEKDKLYHLRDVKIAETEIPGEIMKTINQWKECADENTI